MHQHTRTLLPLLHLADSALPIGSAAHSFGLESLVAEHWLQVEQLDAFLHDYLAEAGVLECTCCLLAHRLGARISETALDEEALTHWLALNARLGALKMARESREASATLGRRLLHLAQGYDLHPHLPALLAAARTAATATHHSLAFGLLGGLLRHEETQVAQAYLQQTLTGLVSACQRLLPLGQSRASGILWHLHPAIVATVARSAVAATEDDLSCFTPLVDLSSMRHPALTTRLFIS